MKKRLSAVIMASSLLLGGTAVGFASPASAVSVACVAEASAVVNAQAALQAAIRLRRPTSVIVSLQAQLDVAVAALAACRLSL